MPNGIVSTDDMLTQGLLMALGRHGLRAGEDVRIATQANQGSPALLGWEDRITRLEFAPIEIVATMFAALEALMDGETPVGTTPVTPDPSYPSLPPAGTINSGPSAPGQRFSAASTIFVTGNGSGVPSRA